MRLLLQYYSYSPVDCQWKFNARSNSNQSNAMMIEQLSSSNEKIRCLIRPEDIKRERESARARAEERKSIDDLDGTLESPGWRVSWRSIASVSGQTPWCGDAGPAHGILYSSYYTGFHGLPLKHGNCVRLALPPAGMESSMYLHTHCLSLDVLISQRFLVTAFLRIIFDDWR